MPLKGIRCFAVGAVFCAPAIIFAPAARAQSLNVDIEGNGLPSSSFGAAASQAGVWNAMTFSGPTPLVGLNGAATTATLAVIASSTTVSVLSFNNPANTGDFALLFNDGAQIGTVTQGGSRTYQFNGLLDGAYQVYTYGSPPQGINGHLNVNVLNSNEGTLSTSGIMTPNTFALGVTHVVHTLNVIGGNITVELGDVPGSPSAYISGFQLVMVPAPGALALLLAAPLVRARRRR